MLDFMSQSGFRPGGLEGPPRCAAGHPMTPVRRSGGSRPVCPQCLGAAFGVAAARSRTANDFLAAYEAGEVPALPPREAAAVQAIIQAAGELHGETDASACRRVIRDAAKASGVTTREVMGWPLTRVSEALSRMAAAAA